MSASRAYRPAAESRVVYQQGGALVYPPVARHPIGERATFVGAGHARESDGSGRSASEASTAFAAMGRSYNGGGRATCLGNGRASVGAGHARESDGSGRDASAASTAFAAMGRSYNGGGRDTCLGNGRASVGAGHARESDGSGRDASAVSTAFAAMGRSYNGGGRATRLGNGRASVGAGHGRESVGSGRDASAASTAFAAMGRSYGIRRVDCCRVGAQGAIEQTQGLARSVALASMLERLARCAERDRPPTTRRPMP